MTTNANLSRLYSSYPENERRYKTLEIFHEVMPEPKRLFLSGTEGTKSFKLESAAPRNPSETVDFIGAHFEINEPSVDKNDNSLINIQLGLDSLIDINEVLNALNLATVEFLKTIEIIYRVYHSADVLIGPSQTPTLVFSDGFKMLAGKGSILSATTTNFSLQRTGGDYTKEDFPGLITG